MSAFGEAMEPEVEVILPEDYQDRACLASPAESHLNHQRVYLYDSEEEDAEVLVPAVQAYSRMERQAPLDPHHDLHHDPDDLGFIDGGISDGSDDLDPGSTGAVVAKGSFLPRVQPSANQNPRLIRHRKVNLSTQSQSNIITIDATTEQHGQDKGGKGRNLTNREFHRPSTFVRARYPTKFHGDKIKTTEESRVKEAAMKLPPSFRPRTRYGKEARVVSDSHKRSSLRPWPTPPTYPLKPRVKDMSVDCHILRMVETMDIGTQNVPLVTSKQSQSGNPTREAYTQYPRVRRQEVGLNPMEIQTSHQGIQSVPDTKNAMVETSVSIMFYPNVVITEDRGTQVLDEQGAPDTAAHNEDNSVMFQDGGVHCCPDDQVRSETHDDQYSADDFEDESDNGKEKGLAGNENVKPSGTSMLLGPLSQSADAAGHTDSPSDPEEEGQPFSVMRNRPSLGATGRTSSVHSVEVAVRDDVHDLH